MQIKLPKLDTVSVASCSKLMPHLSPGYRPVLLCMALRYIRQYFFLDRRGIFQIFFYNTWKSGPQANEESGKSLAIALLNFSSHATLYPVRRAWHRLLWLLVG